MDTLLIMTLMHARLYLQQCTQITKSSALQNNECYNKVVMYDMAFYVYWILQLLQAK